MYVCQCLYVCTSRGLCQRLRYLTSKISSASLTVKVAKREMLCNLLKYILIGCIQGLTLDNVELNENNWLDPCTAEGYIG